MTDNERKTGRLPAVYEYNLPTEAQWEYAARGGHLFKGCKYSDGDNMDDVGWSIDNIDYSLWHYWYFEGVKWYAICYGYSETHSVGRKQPNECGVYGMSENVHERCRDCCKIDDYKMIATDTYRDGVEDPCCQNGEFQMYRGGNYYMDADGCRVAARSGGHGADVGNVEVGFRVVLVPVP